MNGPPLAAPCPRGDRIAQQCPENGQKGVSFIDCVEGVLHSHPEMRRIIRKLETNKWNAVLAGIPYSEKASRKEES